MFTLTEAAERIGVTFQELEELKNTEPGLFEKVGNYFYIDAVNLEFLRFQMRVARDNYRTCGDSFLNVIPAV